MALKRTVKSCRSGAPMPASSLREEAQATVSNKPGHRGEREVSRKTIARGMPGETGVTVVTNSCVCFFTHEAAGASAARHSLRPLNFRRRNVLGKPRAGRAARSRTYVSRHCEERSDEAIHCFFAWLHGLLRFARNDAQHAARTRSHVYEGAATRRKTAVQYASSTGRNGVRSLRSGGARPRSFGGDLAGSLLRLDRPFRTPDAGQAGGARPRLRAALLLRAIRCADFAPRRASARPAQNRARRPGRGAGGEPDR